METKYDIYEEDEIIYLDVNILNNSKMRIPAKFSITRASPILNYPPSKYYCSVQRFTVPLQCMPLKLFFVDDGIISIKYNNHTTSEYLQFQRMDFNNDINLNNANGDLVGGIYHYQTYCDIINECIKKCCNNLSIGGIIPYITFDIITGLFTIYFPLTWGYTSYPYTTDPTKPQLFFNKILGQLFPSFNSISYDSSINNNNCDMLIICTNQNNNSYIDDNSNKFYFNRQEWKSTQYLCSLSNISITSSLIPLRNENITNNLTFQQNGFSNKYLPILSDFEINKEEIGVGRSICQYTSQNNRYIPLTGDILISNIDISFYAYYQGLIGQISSTPAYQPIILNPYDNITLKLMFKLKKLNY